MRLRLLRLGVNGAYKFSSNIASTAERESSGTWDRKVDCVVSA